MVAIDPEHDLAMLKVRGVANLPVPIDVNHTPELTETMPVTVLGFPFGKVLSTGKAGPAITIGKASISSIRRDDNDDLAYVQIDGALNPGNSGGPVVDSEGRLVGVAVATIKGSSGIGLAIPAQELTKMLQGRVGSAVVNTQSVSGGTAQLRVEIPLIDPMKRLRSVTLHYIQGKPTAHYPRQPDGNWRELAGATRVAMTMVGDRGTGSISVPAPTGSGGSFTFQTSYVTTDGKTHFDEPATYTQKAPGAGGGSTQSSTAARSCSCRTASAAQRRWRPAGRRRLRRRTPSRCGSRRWIAGRPRGRSGQVRSFRHHQLGTSDLPHGGEGNRRTPARNQPHECQAAGRQAWLRRGGDEGESRCQCRWVVTDLHAR